MICKLYANDTPVDTRKPQSRIYRTTLCLNAVLAVGRCPSVTLAYCIETA